MARRPNLAAIDLKNPSKQPPPDADRGRKRASTLRLPPETWHRLRILAAVRNTSQLAIVEEALTQYFARNPLPDGLGL
jgi:hypothetical protein